MFLLFLKDSMTALKRLDDFFASDEVKPLPRYPSPTDTVETITVVSHHTKTIENFRRKIFLRDDIDRCFKIKFFCEISAKIFGRKFNHANYFKLN
jgi:hypothetical protein